jgi:hypothetical protein
MGWTVSDLDKHWTLADAKAQHVKTCIAYSADYKATLIDYEWRPKTFYAIIELTKPNGKAERFLRTDMIDTSNNQFGYKDMTEEMGPHVEDSPSYGFKEKIFQWIPITKGYAGNFRTRHGIKYSTTDKDLFGNYNAAIKPDLLQHKMEV